MKADRRERITIMDGKVIEFAEAFAERTGIMGARAEAQGPYHVSASRNAVVVHRAVLSSPNDVADFLEALRVAQAAASDLARRDRGDFQT